MNWDIAAGLAGQGVVITGATGGIGRVVAHAFADAGAQVVAVDRSQSTCDALVAALPGDGHTGIAVDLQNAAGRAAVLAAAREHLPRFDVLVHLAAVLIRQDLAQVTEADWDAQMDVNLKASFFLCRDSGLLMRDVGRGGRIITFASQGWWTGGFGGSITYNAAKGGMVTLTRGLARAFGPAGITVNAVAPGLIETPMLTDGLPEADLHDLIAQTPLGRLGQPEDVAGAVLFLASRHAAFISGATLNISGGFLMY